MNLNKFEQNFFAVTLASVLLMGVMSVTPTKETHFINTAYASEVKEVKLDKNMPVVYIVGKKLSKEEKLAMR